MSMWLLVLAVLTFAHAADVCTDGECHDADGGLSMLQGSRERTAAISSHKMLSGDLQQPEKQVGCMDAGERETCGDEKSWCQITCPVIGALFKAGDLVPDPTTGHVKKAQVVEAMLRVGLDEHLVNETTNGNFDHLVDGNGGINLFNMDLAQNSNKSERHRNVEHDFSTGIRDGATNNKAEYEEFEQFIGADSSWNLSDIENAIEYYKTSNNSNDAGTGEGGINSLKNMFIAFNDQGNKTLSKHEMKQLFLDSDYPADFKKRRNKAVNTTMVSGNFTYCAN